MKTAFSMLGPTSQTAYAEELERLWSEHNEDENGKTITQKRISGSYWNATVAADGTGRIPVAVTAQTIVLATTPARSINYVCISIRMLCEVQRRSGR